MMNFSIRTIDSPVGPLTILVNEKGFLKRIDFGYTAAENNPDAADGIVNELNQYFAGKRTVFDVPLQPDGTPFQQSVWKQLLQIPYGKTCSYGDLANALGRPTLTRAVGAANGANPIPIIIPCHRVIGANGSLIGYGGGLHIKARLLELEGVLAPSLL